MNEGKERKKEKKDETIGKRTKGKIGKIFGDPLVELE